MKLKGTDKKQAARRPEIDRGQPELLRERDPSTLVVIRTEKRSWLALAFTGFGAFILRYLRTVRVRGRQTRKG